MTYEIKIAPSALDQVYKWNIDEQRLLQTRLVQLAEHPVKLSRPASVPGEMPGRQVFVFPIVQGSIDCKVFFQYEQNESALWIAAIARGPSKGKGRQTDK